MPRCCHVVLPLCAVVGCTVAPHDPDLRVAAASDLQAVFPALAEGFHRATGLEVEFVAGGSGPLAQQIRQGAPFDVFLSADLGFVRQLAAERVIEPGSVRPYAIGALVLAVHRDAPVAVAALEDLTLPEVKRIALANPEAAPYGRAARQALERSGLWQTLQPKLVRSETVGQALQFVRTGNADAGLIALALADVPEIRALPIDSDRHEPIVQGLGIVAATRRLAAAEAFAGFLLARPGQEILARYGFQPVDPDG